MASGRWLRSLALLRRPFPRSRLLRRCPADWRGRRRRRRASPGCAAGVAWPAVPVTDQGRRGIAPRHGAPGQRSTCSRDPSSPGVDILGSWAARPPQAAAGRRRTARHRNRVPRCANPQGASFRCPGVAVRRRLQACSGGYFASSAGSRMRPGDLATKAKVSDHRPSAHAAG